MHQLNFLLAAASLIAVVAPAAAQPASSSASASRPIDSRAVIADVRRILRDNYVLPAVRPKFDAGLAQALQSGRFNVGDPAELVNRINADLTAIAHDKHVGIMYAPSQYAELVAQPPGSGADDAPPSSDDIRRAVRNNHGISSLKLLGGNVRYLEYNGFAWAGPKTAEALDNAMRFLRDGDAVIIDLRKNGGGSPDAVQYLVSHFMEPNRPIVTFYMRGDPASPLSTLASLPAGRMVGKPLYVLTSGHTASAAEEFSGHVAGFKLGELVGETTAGAGFRNEFFPVAGGFVLSVSVGRAVLASTGKDWEGVGISPTTKVDPDKALEITHARALRRLALSAPISEKAALEAGALSLEAQVVPIAPGAPLSRYAGNYGERIIGIDNGALIMRRGGGPKRALVAVGPQEFAFVDDPLTRIKFSVVGSAVSGFELMRSDGSRVVANRSP